ncbi:DUF4382 domain-containing protein [Persephonella sp. KM09-Lau-8]|uniref:DUF4382 domain-containing protein n=1 Tax=Persephonella sp. KM09-Lau-8 TaxID=1158345 RepID=UPI000498611D|nr:DUF4382 domain-containing protein [Persephonella sp. KM09-Lau-8]
MKRIISLAAIISGGIFLFSCGGGGGSDSSTQSVQASLVLTDSPADTMSSIFVDITSVSLKHTGRNTECNLFTADPQNNPLKNINLLELKDILYVINTTSCPEGNYNRLRIEFKNNIEVIDSDGNSYTCKVKEFNLGSNKQPNKPHCDNNGNCFVEINGAINLLSKQSDVIVDFDLANSIIDIDTQTGDCEITFKMSPLVLEHHKFKELESHKKIMFEGKITDLNTSSKTFILHNDDKDITVDYSAALNSQNGLENLLTLASDMNSKYELKVICNSLDSNTCLAGKVILEIKNVIVSNLDTTSKTFQISINGSQTITVNYSNAKIKGELSEGVNVEIELIGYSDDNYIAKVIKVED